MNLEAENARLKAYSNLIKMFGKEKMKSLCGGSSYLSFSKWVNSQMRRMENV